MKNLVWQQNRHQKVSTGELYSTFVFVQCLDILKFEQTSLFYSASYFNLGRGVGALFWRAKPTKGPPW